MEKQVLLLRKAGDYDFTPTADTFGFASLGARGPHGDVSQARRPLLATQRRESLLQAGSATLGTGIMGASALTQVLRPPSRAQRLGRHDAITQVTLRTVIESIFIVMASDIRTIVFEDP